MQEKYQTFKRDSKITIQPYVTDSENMGLEKYKLVLFDGVMHEEPLICLEQNGVKRYVTGLNEFAPEIKSLPDEEKKAVIKQIKETVSQLEKELASNVIDPKSKDFWKEVKLLRPDNDEFWNKISMRYGNEPIFLDPENDPYDLIKLKAIEAGGFSMVAKSLEDARNRKGKKPVKFYLDKYEETATIRTEVKKLRNKAGALLQELYDSNVTKLLYVCKVIDSNSAQYTKRTPNDVLYDNMDKYINGESVDRDKRKTAKKFIEIAELDMETLKLKALVRDSTYYKEIAIRGDGFIYHVDSNTSLGKNPSDVVEFLRNPLHTNILGEITRKIETYWNR